MVFSRVLNQKSLTSNAKSLRISGRVCFKHLFFHFAIEVKEKRVPYENAAQPTVECYFDPGKPRRSLLTLEEFVLLIARGTVTPYSR